MRTKKLAYLIGGFFILLILACDPYGGYEYWVDNQSDTLLYVSWREINNETLHTTDLGAKDRILLLKFSTNNGLNDFKNRFLTGQFDSLGIYLDTTNKVKIKKDYQDRSAWTYTKEITGSIGLTKAGENIYELKIENKDLQ